MRQVVVLLVLGLVSAAPAYAAHGSIEETDTAIIVEYTGDAKDKAPDAVPQNFAKIATEAAGNIPKAAVPMVVAKGDSPVQRATSSQSSSNRESRSKRRQLRSESSHRPDQDLSKLAPPPASTSAKD